MKRNLILAAATASLLTSCNSGSNKMEAAFAEAQQMVDQMVVAEFCKDTFDIRNYGASEEADAATNKKAITEAIDKCNSTGGGVVLVPAGKWTTGPLTLKSNVNLHVAKDASLLFSTNYEDYEEVVDTRWEGVDCKNLHPLIYANDAINVGITGEGIIDGQSDNSTWWYMKGRTRYGWKQGMRSQEDGGRDSLLAYDRNKVPMEARQPFCIEDALRPQLINIRNCKQVIIEGVTLRNSPFWTVHPLFVENLIVRNVKIENHGPNGDGCDPESCKNVLIEGCFFDTGDDCIAIKSGRNNDGRRWARPSENIYVRNCMMKNGHGGVVLGSEIAGGFKNLWVENCKMDSPELDRVIRIKTSDCRGGVIENVWVRNIEVGNCYECILKINLLYEKNENCDHNYPPMVRNVNLDNVVSTKSKYGVFIMGMENQSERVSDITVTNCKFDNVERGNSITDATGVVFDNLRINGREVTLE